MMEIILTSSTHEQTPGKHELDEAFSAFRNLIPSSMGDSPQIDSLSVLLKQEKSYRLKPSRKNPMNYDWFRRMSLWSYKVASALEIESEIVEIGLNIMYRYITSMMDESDDDISAREFRIISLTSLYIACKIDEENSLTPNDLEVLGRNKIFADDIFLTESKILFQLKWKVNPPTIMAFARCFLDYIGHNTTDLYYDADLIFEIVEGQAREAMIEADFEDTKVSVLALNAVLSALKTEKHVIIRSKYPSKE